MNQVEISVEIIRRIVGSESPSFKPWTVGITGDIQRRMKEHVAEGKDVKHVKSWPANDANAARSVEALFKEAGMKGGTGGDIDESKPVFVYIF